MLPVLQNLTAITAIRNMPSRAIPFALTDVLLLDGCGPVEFLCCTSTP